MVDKYRHREQITWEGHVSIASEFFTERWGLHDEFYILVFWGETEWDAGVQLLVNGFIDALFHLGVKSMESPMNV